MRAIVIGAATAIVVAMALSAVGFLTHNYRETALGIFSLIISIPLVVFTTRLLCRSPEKTITNGAIPN